MPFPLLVRRSSRSIRFAVPARRLIAVLGLGLLLWPGCQQVSTLPARPELPLAFDPPAGSRPAPFAAWTDALSVAKTLSHRAREFLPRDYPRALRLWQYSVFCYDEAFALAPREADVLSDYAVAERDFAEAICDRDLPAARALWGSARGHLRAALRSQPHDAYLLEALAYTFDLEARALPASALPEARALWREGRGLHEQAFALAPTDAFIIGEWGSSFTNEAEHVAPVQLGEALALWTQGEAKYAQALSLQPDRINTLSNWGLALSNQALACAHGGRLDVARGLWAQAAEKYRAVIAVDPNFLDASYNYGTTLYEEAQALKDVAPAECRQLLALAEHFLQHAATLAPDRANIQGNLALVYDRQARAAETSDPAEALRLWLLVGDHAHRALQLRPDSTEFFISVGNAFGHRAPLLAPHDLPAARLLWQQARAATSRALDSVEKINALENIAIFLKDEAEALAPSDLSAALDLWDRAHAQYLVLAAAAPAQASALMYAGDIRRVQAVHVASTDVPRALQFCRLAEPDFTASLNLDPAAGSTYRFQASLFSLEGRLLYATDRTAAFAAWSRADAGYAKALALGESKSGCLLDRAIHLREAGLVTQDTVSISALVFFDASLAAGRELLTLDPSSQAGLELVAQDCSLKAHLLIGQSPTSARPLWEESSRRYAELAEKYPVETNAFINSGFVLSQEAADLAAQDLPAARRLWADSIARQELALARLPHDAYYLRCLGFTWSRQALALAPSDLALSREMFLRAAGYFTQALAVKPDYLEVAKELGFAYLRAFASYPRAERPDRLDLRQQAEDAMRVAERLSRGSAAYNLACLSALKWDVPATIAWLKLAQETHTLPNLQTIQRDIYLAEVSASAPFQTWLKSAFPAH